MGIPVASNYGWARVPAIPENLTGAECQAFTMGAVQNNKRQSVFIRRIVMLTRAPVLTEPPY